MGRAEGREPIPRLNQLIDTCRERGVAVIFTRHVDRPGRPSGAMVKWWGHPLRSDDPLSELCPHLECGPREIHFKKNHYSAFRETRLQVLLNQLGAEAVVITGVLTHLCCESTARDAFMRDFVDNEVLPLSDEIEAESGILFIPGWLRMAELALHSWARPLAVVTKPFVKLFRLLSRRFPGLRRHGYLLATAAKRPL